MYSVRLSQPQVFQASQSPISPTAASSDFRMFKSPAMTLGAKRPPPWELLKQCSQLSDTLLLVVLERCQVDGRHNTVDATTAAHAAAGASCNNTTSASYDRMSSATRRSFSARAHGASCEGLHSATFHVSSELSAGW